MNNDKTEFILFRLKPQLEKCKTKTLNVDNTEIELADRIKYLGVILDQNLNFKKHITSKCQTTMLNLQHIKNHQTPTDPGTDRNSGPRDSNITSGLLQQHTSQSSRS